MKHVIVTGGAGFLGSHLCDLLIQNGFKVTVIDNLITGREENIMHLLGNSNFTFLNQDVANEWMSVEKADFIFHLASPASPDDYQAFPEETITANVLGTWKVLKMAKEWNARVLITSTSEVYGDPLVHPQVESYWGNVNSHGPRSCYDESKRMAETLSYVYEKKHNVDVRLVRIFNTYGPRMKANDGRVISNFINQALKNIPITIYGKGDATRSFCFYSDLVSGLYKYMFTEELKGEVINMGNPGEFTILELANMVKEMTHSKSEIVFKEEAKDDPHKRKPDITKAKKLLNWEPKVTLKEGLTETIKYYKVQLKGKKGSKSVVNFL